jgi:hypothetical protein
MYTQAEVRAAVFEAVTGLKKNGNDPFKVEGIVTEISGHVSGVHAGTADEVKRILDSERQRLDIREADIGGQSWTFGYAPRPTSRLI